MTHLLPILVSTLFTAAHAATELHLYTVATQRTDGLQRFLRAAKHNGFVEGKTLHVLGLDETWKGGDVQNGLGGGQKVRLLRSALKQHSKDDKRVVLFADAYDVVVGATAEDLLERFGRFKDAKVVFSAEGFCWPDKTLANDYPVVKSGKRYLNSGAFMGYAPELYEIVSNEDIKDMDDDQLYYTKIYLNKKLRESLGIVLDPNSKIFQNLNGAVDDLDLTVDDNGKPVLQNVAYNTLPAVVHGNGPTPMKVALNYFANYIAGAWSEEDGCVFCKDDTLSLPSSDAAMPRILLSIHVVKSTVFLDMFLERLVAQNYPKSRIDVLLHVAVLEHVEEVREFEEKYKKYSSIKLIEPSNRQTERQARVSAVKHALEVKADYIFMVDCEAQITNENTLRLLIEQHRPIVAPMLIRPGKLWSNFWGAISADGFYERSDDYASLVQNKRQGLWNVPYVNNAYLVSSDLFGDLAKSFEYISEKVDVDMSFCSFMRHRGHFMYVSNRVDFGHLLSLDNPQPDRAHPELYQLLENPVEWKARYMHPEYAATLVQPLEKYKQPCPDVYWVPLFSERWAADMIEEMEHFGKWSGGSNEDERLAGGYENVPTRDIHMNQVGLEHTWLTILNDFVKPIQEKLYIGYFSNPKPSALMNFVVRYRPDEQPSLRPHHDASTYTLNVALNKPGVDYEGGGARFLRYNCAVTDTQVGWTLIHPGRLTHMHEGLPVTKGTRYIMVSFVDP